MAHSRLNQSAMFDWIERCLSGGEPMPDDAAIMDQFNFTSSEQARTLLADLADAGRITIKWADGDRTVTLGRSKGARLTPARVEAASVVRRAPDGRRLGVDAGEVLARPFHVAPRVAVTPTASPAGRMEATAPASEGEQPAAAQARVEAAPPIIHGEVQQVEESPAPLTQQGAATPGSRKRRPAGNVAKQHDGPGPDRVVGPRREPVDLKRLLTAPGRKLAQERVVPIATRADRRQLNIHFPQATFVQLEQRATADGQSVAAFARATLIAAVGAPEPAAAEPPSFPTGKKPFIPATVIRAARAAGQPLDIFVTAMILRGFATYQGEQPAVRAA